MKPISSIQAFQLVPDGLNLAYLLFRGAKKKHARERHEFLVYMSHVMMIHNDP